MISLPPAQAKIHFMTSLIFNLIGWMLLSDLRKPCVLGVYNHFQCLNIPQKLCCTHILGFSSQKFLKLYQVQNCQIAKKCWMMMLANGHLNSWPALAGTAVWFAKKDPVSNCHKILPPGVKYAFMDPITKPFSNTSYAYTLPFQCIDTLYFSRRLE